MMIKSPKRLLAIVGTALALIAASAAGPGQIVAGFNIW